MSFIHWFKSRIHASNFSENTKAFIDTCAGWGSAIHCRAIFTPASTYIYRRGSSCDIQYTKQTVLRTEDQLCFFIDYHKHSADIVEVIKNAFGRESGILGRCTYTMDAINIELPKEPGLINIGLARDHLQYGYPCTWNNKTAAEVECKQKIEEMKTVYVQIENRIKTIIEKDIGTIGNRLVGKSTYYMPESTYFQSFYYDNLVPQIYFEIISRSEGNPRKGVNFSYEYPRLSDENGKEIPIELGILLIGFMKVAAGKVNDMKELEARLRKLLYEDPDLQSSVLKVNSLKDELDMNKTSNTYFNEIDALHESIFQEGAEIKGKCKLCPPKGWINYF